LKSKVNLILTKNNRELFFYSKNKKNAQILGFLVINGKNTPFAILYKITIFARQTEAHSPNWNLVSSSGFFYLHTTQMIQNYQPCLFQKISGLSQFKARY